MSERNLKLSKLIALFNLNLPQPEFERQFCLALAELFEAEFASIFAYDSQAQRLRFQCAPNLPHAVTGNFEFKLGEGVCGTAARQRRAVAVEDAGNCPNHVSAVDEASGLITRTLLAAPILRDGQCLGVLELINRTNGNFSEDEGCLLELVGLLYGQHAPRAGSGTHGPHAAETQSARMPEEPVIIGISPAIERVLRLTLRISQTDLPILIMGETGTGKELVARRLHQASRRAHLPLICINCAALSENILESELFGHVKGAFTGADRNRRGRLEEAHGGTIFLDEVGDMSPACQAKLLRALEYGEIVPMGGNAVRKIDVRILSATNQPLQERIAKERFRVDLYYRLCGMVIHVPPLRERLLDIELLAGHFLERLCRDEGRALAGFTAEAMALLRAHRWPGNVRELKRIVESAFMLADGDWITPADLPDLASPRPRGSDEGGERGVDENRNPMRQQPEEFHRIREALTATAYRGSGRWNITGAAARLGLPRKTLEYKIKTVYQMSRDGQPHDDA